MRMMRCLATITFSVTGVDRPAETICPPMEVDFDRVLRPAAAAKGKPDDPDYVPEVTRVTLADVVKGREDCFEPVEKSPDASAASVRSAQPPAAAAVAAKE
jgi:hypothetical protein